MSEAPYTQTAHLSGGHSRGITAVAFNLEGSLLATADLSGTVCIWNTGTWTVVDAYYAGKAVVSIAWFAHNALVCGLEDGTLSSLVKDDEHITITGFWAHRYPIEHVAISGHLVATGAHEELRIWNWNLNAALVTLVKVLPPPATECDETDDDNNNNNDDSESDDDEVGTDKSKKDGSEVLVTGVGWATSAVVVTYLHHGIRLYDNEHWKLVKVVDPKGTIISSSLSPNGGYLAASNLAVGFDIYDLQSCKVIRTFEHNVGDHGRAVPVLFVHGGHAIVAGSTTGSIKIWYIDAAQQLAPMTMPHSQTVLAIAAHYDKQGDRFLIATGIMNERSSSSVIIWTSASGGHVSDEDSEHGACEDVSQSVGGPYFLGENVLYMFVIVCIVAAFGFAIFKTEVELMVWDEGEDVGLEDYV